jgi:hypothetical protein
MRKTVVVVGIFGIIEQQAVDRRIRICFQINRILLLFSNIDSFIMRVLQMPTSTAMLGVQSHVVQSSSCCSCCWGKGSAFNDELSSAFQRHDHPTNDHHLGTNSLQRSSQWLYFADGATRDHQMWWFPKDENCLAQTINL